MFNWRVGAPISVTLCFGSERERESEEGVFVSNDRRRPFFIEVKFFKVSFCYFQFQKQVKIFF